MRHLKNWTKRLIRSPDPPEKPPQLIMWYTLDAAPDIEEVEGSQVRAYRSGDEAGWLDLLQANGELGAWDRERLDGVLANTHHQLFAECGETIAACTGINDQIRDIGACWEIGWVAVHPDFQGRGLSKFIVGVAIAQALNFEQRPLYLLTDDFRVPALRCYLKLGFAPDDGHPTYPGRWRAVFDGLGPDYQVYKPEFLAAEDPV